MEIVIAIGAVVLLGLTFWVLNRQPHPDDSLAEVAGEDVAGPEGAGPTGESYPPGSRPAGPGAESQDPETPSQPR